VCAGELRQLVPKKKGGMRPVIDLSILNTYLVVPHFKMETNRSIRASMLPGMWSTSLDLTDAYFHCPISVTFPFSWGPRRGGNKILDPGKKLEPILLLPSATEQTLPLTDVDVCEDPKRLKREWETPTEAVSVNVRLNDGKRTIASSSSGYQPTPNFSAKRRKVIRLKQYANSSKTPHAQKSEEIS
jgi:hypothetical protein